MAYQLVTLANGLNQYVNVAGGLVPRGEYDPLVSYVIGDMVDFGGSSYVMYNTAPAGTDPTDATYWGLVAQKGDPGSVADFVGNWTTATSYAPDVCVTNDGSSYYCIAPHTSGATNEPGTGVDWQDYWQLSAQKGDPGANGAGVPVGGAAGQILAKIDGTDYNTQWIDNFSNVVKQQVKLGEAVNKGQAVYVSSGSGSNIIVSKADNGDDSTSLSTLGIVETSGVLNDHVNVVTEGMITGLNTNSANVGDPVWLGTAGDLLFGIANKPVAPAHIVYLGTVIRKSATVGEIYVSLNNGWELDELHNVLISSPTNGQALIYDNTTSLWKNQTIVTGDARIASSVGNNNISLRDSASVTGQWNTAIGQLSGSSLNNSSGYNTLVGGGTGSAVTSGEKNVLIGLGAGGAISTGSHNTIVGTNSFYNYNGDYNVMLGYTSGIGNSPYPLYGGYLIAIGTKHNQPVSPSMFNPNTYSISIGYETNVWTHSIGIGTFAKATEIYNVGIGYMAYATGQQSVAMGYNTTSSGAYTVTIGNGSTSSSTYGVSVGYSLTTGSDSINIGHNTSLSGTSQIAIGQTITNSSNYGIALGYYAEATSDTGAVAIGYQAKAQGFGTVSIGYQADTYGSSNNHAVSIGTRSSAADQAVSIGVDSYARYINSVAIGTQTAAGASGYGITLVGSTAASNNLYASAFGHGATANYDYSVAIGYNAATTAANQIMLGRSNEFVRVPNELSYENKIYPTGTPASGSGNASQDLSIDKPGFIIEAMAQDTNINNPTGTPRNFQRFVIRLKADGTTRNVTWSSNWRGGTPALPASVAANTTTYCEFMYNSLDSKWDLVSVASGI